MTSDYHRIVEENHNLIYGFLNKHKLGEDFYGDAAIGLCKAVQTFDESIGNSFATYAYKCMFNECGTTMRTEKRNVKTISFETRINVEEQMPLKLEDVLLDEQGYENMKSIPYVVWFIDNMCLIDLQILLYRLQGDSYREVARKIGCTYQTVKNRLNKIGTIYKMKRRYNSKNDIDDPLECQRVKSEILAFLNI